MNDDLPRSRQGVRETYDRIANHFSKTRQSPWPEVEAFLEDVPVGHLGLDVGCGNGRHLPVLRKRVDKAVGLDVSREILREAKSRHPRPLAGRVLQADATSLPIATGVVAVGLSIATVHHLPDRTARVSSLRELGRVITDRGRALVSAWSTTHDRFEATAGFDTIVDWTMPDGETVPRFYHIYAPEEFVADVEAAGLDIMDHYVSSGNCYAEVRP